MRANIEIPDADQIVGGAIDELMLSVEPVASQAKASLDIIREHLLPKVEKILKLARIALWSFIGLCGWGAIAILLALVL